MRIRGSSCGSGSKMGKSARFSLSFRKTLKDLLSWFRFSKVRGLIIGGVALSFLGRPRLTEDIDGLVLIDRERWDSFLDAGKRFGFSSRISGPIPFAQGRRMLLLKHAETGVEVDISLGLLPFEKECLKRKILVRLGDFSVPVPSVEDLVIMKAVAHRPQDLADIDSLLAVHPKLDKKRIRRWVKEFASVLEMPEIFEDLEKNLKR